MPRARNPDSIEAEKLYHKGMLLVEIAKKLNVPAGTVRRWKSTQGWDNNTKPETECAKTRKTERSETKIEKPSVRKRGAPKGNKNAKGAGAPKRNQNAVKHGFFSKYLPEDALSIIDDIEDKDYIDILWENIQICYAAILRSQKIMYVENKEELIKEIKKMKKMKGEKGGAEIEWEFQFSWDRQATFLTAQARAMSELRALIKQYEEIASEEQLAKVEKIKAETKRIKIENTDRGDGEVDDWISGVTGEGERPEQDDINE